MIIIDILQVVLVSRNAETEIKYIQQKIRGLTGRLSSIPDGHKGGNGIRIRVEATQEDN